MPLLFCGGRHAGPQPDVSEEPSKKAEDEGTGGHAAVPAGVRQAERREILMRTVPGVMTSFYKVTQHSSTSFTLIFPILVLIQHVRIDQSNIFVYLENKSVKHHIDYTGTCLSPGLIQYVSSHYLLCKWFVTMIIGIL